VDWEIKLTSQEHIMMATAAENVTADVVNQAVEGFNSALRAGLKAQEESVRWWLDAMGEAGSVQALQKKVEEFVETAIPTMQKNTQDYLKVLDENSRNSLELLKKALDTTQSDSMAEVQGKMRELWEGSLSAVRRNVQSMLQLNSRIMQSYGQLLVRSGGNGDKA
jgi:hypothetical protein